MRQQYLWLLAAAVGCSGGHRRGAQDRPTTGARDGSPNFTLTLPRASGAASAAPELQPEAPVAMPALTETAPDPAPLASQRQFEFDLVYDRGAVRVRHVEVRLFANPVVTARRIGRYAIELWIGRELVERVRFDFPIIGAEPVPTGRRALDAPPSLLPGALAERRVLVPASERATRAVLVDRATGDRWDLPWPPDAPLAPPARDDSSRGRPTSAAGRGPAGAPSAAEPPDPGEPALDAGASPAAGPDAGTD